QLTTAGIMRLEAVLHDPGGHSHVIGLARTEAGQWVVSANALAESDLANLDDVSHHAPGRTIALPVFGRARLLSGTFTVNGQPLEILLLADLEHMDEEMELVLWSLLGTTPVA